MGAMKIGRVLLVGGLLLAVGLGGSARAGEEAKRLRLAYAGWEVGTAVAYVGIDSGIFKENGLEVEEVFIRDTLGGGVQALIGVDIVLGFGNPLAILKPILEGSDIVFLGSHVKMEAYGLAVAGGIDTVQALRGKKIGVSGLGGRSDLVARVVLRRAGLDPAKDVEIVPIGLGPARVVALSRGLVQAVPLGPDLLDQVRPLGIKVIEVKDVPIVTGLLMTTRSLTDKNGEAIRRFMKGYVKAIHYFLTRRQESIAILRRYMSGVAANALDGMYETFRAELAPLPMPNGEAARSIIDAAAGADERAKKLRPSDLFDLRFLDELKASGFVEELYSEKVSL
jgi:ABC-type nitrate/sulfonate/bicarbonate transport system substrate-binding protein